MWKVTVAILELHRIPDRCGLVSTIEVLMIACIRGIPLPGLRASSANPPGHSHQYGTDDFAKTSLKNGGIHLRC